MRVTIRFIAAFIALLFILALCSMIIEFYNYYPHNIGKFGIPLLNEAVFIFLLDLLPAIVIIIASVSVISFSKFSWYAILFAISFHIVYAFLNIFISENNSSESYYELLMLLFYCSLLVPHFSKRWRKEFHLYQVNYKITVIFFLVSTLLWTVSVYLFNK